MRLLSLLICAIFLTACDGDGDGRNIAINQQNIDIVSFENDGDVITEVTINEDTALQGMQLVITDSKTDAEFYQFTADSSNKTLLPSENIVITGTDKFRDLTITPAANQFGTTTISGVMRNTKTGVEKTTQIDLIVLPVNDLPTITANTSITLLNGLTPASQTLVFTVSDIDSTYAVANITTDFNTDQLIMGDVGATVITGEFSLVITSKDFVEGNTTVTLTITDPGAEADQQPVYQAITVSVSNTDSDNDAIPDYTDNCLSVENANQANQDNDSVGNECDSDDDNDGVLDINDVYPLISLGGLTDTDGDGMPDICDAACLALGMFGEVDTTAPVLALVKAVTTTTGDTITRYTFSSSEAGTIIYGGDCTSLTTAAISGNNRITFAKLSLGLHTNCTIQVKDANDNTSTALAINSFTVIKAKPMNDTGITLCGDYAYAPYSLSHNNDVVCALASPAATKTSQGTETGNGLDPVPAGQDAVYGRDIDVSINSITGLPNNADTDGHKGFSYTKLKSDGSALAIQTNAWSVDVDGFDNGTEDAGTQWSCVQDNVTGLIWEVKTNKATSDLRDKDFTYSWYNQDSTQNSGHVGYPDAGDNCLTTTRCDTEKYAADVNAATLCGAADWRMPTLEELKTLRNLSRFNPAIDIDFIPNTISGVYVTVSASAFDNGSATNVNFFHGYNNAATKGNSHYFRLVRDVQ